MTFDATDIDFTAIEPDSIDWETFDDIEEYATKEASGILRRLLPQALWDYLFAPTTVDRDVISECREHVVTAYDTVNENYRTAEQRLIRKSQLKSRGGTNISLDEWLERLGQDSYPALTPPRNELDTFEEAATAIDSSLELERQVLAAIEQLGSRPYSQFLKAEEQEFLSRAEQIFSHSIAEGTARRQNLESARQELIRTLENRNETWESTLDALESRAAQYVDLEAYLDDNSLIGEVRRLANGMDTIRSTTDIERCAHAEVKRFVNLEDQVRSLLEELETCRHRYAETEVQALKKRLQSELDTISETLAPAETAGESIPSPDVLRAQIEALQDELTTVRSEAYFEHITEDHQQALAELETQLDKKLAFIDAKTTFDAEYAAVAGSVAAFREEVDPYLEYEIYFTNPEADRISTRIIELGESLETLDNDTPFELLSDQARTRVDQLWSQLYGINDHLTDYNPEFVTRQRDRCAKFFTGLGEGDLALTPAQQRAVIRNDVYNQVVAAAGTGKTLTLTTRIAYLIQEQQIPPEEILVVTYTRKAAREMEDRLATTFGITDVTIQTIHAFGRSIIQETEAHAIDVVDESQIENFVDRHLREAQTDGESEFLDHYFEFLVHFDADHHDEEAFKSREAYIQARADQDYTTLRGEQVRSRAEKLIADFLFTNQVHYRYEDLATWADTAPEKQAYSPDFYLPDDDIYIEHWGIDAAGDVAPWFSWTTDTYHTKLHWAREEFAATEYTLVETYEFEHEAHLLKQALRHRLTHQGVELERMEFEELIDHVIEYEQQEGQIKTWFRQFIEHAKQFDLGVEAIESNLSPSNPRQYHFGQCGCILLDRYQTYLDEHQLIDFADMLHDAETRIRRNPAEYSNRYSHILVDEFQDIGNAEGALIQALTGPEAARLFAVGDDWQSIYSFNGAVLEYFTAFETHFGSPIRTDLTENFRSPPRVLDAGNDLIQHNSDQLEKRVQANVDLDTAPRVHTLQGYNYYDYLRRTRRYVLALVQRYLDAGAAPSDIMILCRYDEAGPFLDEIKRGLQSQSIPYVGNGDQYRGPSGTATAGVAVHSVHQAKGREAKHVILTHAVEGSKGFPQTGNDNDLLDPVQPFDVGGVEEERRLFYVAITRTEQTLDLLTRAGEESRFLAEIAEYTEAIDAGKVEPLDDVGETMSVVVKVDSLGEPWTKQHQRGMVLDRYGGTARFVSWQRDTPPTLEKGRWYALDGVHVGEYKGEKELVVSRNCTVTPLPDGPDHPHVQLSGQGES